MAKEWYHNIPRNGILCKCKYDRDSDQYRVDVITRYNDHPLSDYRFRNNDNTMHALSHYPIPKFLV